MVSATIDHSLGIELMHKHKAGDLTGLTSGAVLFGSTTGGIGYDSTNFHWDDSNNRLGLGINSSLLAKLHIKAGSSTEIGQIIQLAAAPSVNALEIRDSSGNAQLAIDHNFALLAPASATTQQIQARSRTGMGGVGGNFTFEIKRDGTNNAGNGAFLKLTDNAVSAYLKWISNSFTQNVMDFEIHTAPGKVYSSPSTGGNFYFNPLVNTQDISILQIPTQTMYPGGGTPSPQGLLRIKVCPIAATSPNTISSIASLLVDGAPTQSTNMTIDYRYAALLLAGDTDGIPLGLRLANGQTNNAFVVEDYLENAMLSIDAACYQLTTAAEGFLIVQTGDALGSTGFEIGNRGGFNGGRLTNYDLDLVDFVYQAATGAYKVNWRYEARSYENLPINNSSGEFQMLFSAGGGGNALSIGRGGAVFYPYVPGTGIDGSDGVVGIYRADPQGQFHVESKDATTITSIFQATTSQSVSIIEAWDDTDAVISKLSQQGNFTCQGFGARVVSKTTTYTAAHEMVILCDASSGGFTVNLPAAATSTDRVYIIKKTDSSANAVTVDGNGSETIDGATTAVLAVQNQSITISCTGSAWVIW